MADETSRAIDDGGPAYPQHGWTSDPETLARMQAGGMGMSLRDWFAGQALAGLIATGIYDTAATQAYEKADDMLAAREGGAA